MANAWRRQGSPWVGGGLAITYATLLASYPAASYSGFQAFVSNLGANGTLLRSNGTRWLPINGQAKLQDFGAPAAGITNVENVSFQTLLPINSWQPNDTIRIFLTLGKSGTTDQMTGNVYIGPLGTAVDPAVISAAQFMGASIVGNGIILDIKLISDTSAQRLGSGPAAGAGTYSIGNATAQPAAVTISGASTNALYVTVGIKSSNTNNTVSVQGGQILLITP